MLSFSLYSIRNADFYSPRNDTQRTIEGDLFSALVNAGAVSKANAADPKKSSFVRCARTDKGVHASGNIVSMKMIVEDENIVQKINDQLSPQIRVWGYELTNKGFSCYQMCDSRVYEYLLPSHCLLPPHPSTYLARKIVEIAEENGDLDALKSRQEEVANFWEETDEKFIKPILESLPADIRSIVEKTVFQEGESRDALQPTGDIHDSSAADSALPGNEGDQPNTESDERQPFIMEPRQKAIVDAVKAIKAAYLTARRAYRAPASRINRLQECLSRYTGTINFHNYTVQKAHNDPSAKRHIKTFDVNPTPAIIHGTEWLSLKVHGQSFMMHQIRKMVAMATMVVRAGCHPDRIPETYGPERIAIPKAPSLGLLLERPVFDSYNQKAEQLGRQPLDFDRWEKEMTEFKQREIYDRIFREEEETARYVIIPYILPMILTSPQASVLSSIILIISPPNTSSTLLLVGYPLPNSLPQLRLTNLEVLRPLVASPAILSVLSVMHLLLSRAYQRMRVMFQLVARKRVETKYHLVINNLDSFEKYKALHDINSMRPGIYVYAR